jgi:two-component system phosphate regulon response regulator PhoB
MPRKIIIIEDDPDILDIMAYILAEEGYDVLTAKDGAPLQNVHTYNPALILMDNRLTGGQGKDFCRKFKNDPATRHYPIVLVSANVGLEQMARESGADGYLKKPFDISELVDLVKKFARED